MHRHSDRQEDGIPNHSWVPNDAYGQAVDSRALRPIEYGIRQVGSGILQDASRSESYSDDDNAPPQTSQRSDILVTGQPLADEPDDILQEIEHTYRQNPNTFSTSLNYTEPSPESTLFGPLSPQAAPPLSPPSNIQHQSTYPPQIAFSITSSNSQTTGYATATEAVSHRSWHYGTPDPPTPQSLSGWSEAPSQYGNPAAVSILEEQSGWNGSPPGPALLALLARDDLDLPAFQSPQQHAGYANHAIPTAPGGLSSVNTFSEPASLEPNAWSQSSQFIPVSNGSIPMSPEVATPSFQTLPLHPPPNDIRFMNSLVVMLELRSRGVVAGLAVDAVSGRNEHLVHAQLELDRRRMEGKLPGKRTKCLYCDISYADASTRSRHEGIKHLGIQFACTNPTCTDLVGDAKDRPERLKEHVRACRNYNATSISKQLYTSFVVREKINLGDPSVWPSVAEMVQHFAQFQVRLRTFDDVVNNRQAASAYGYPGHVVVG
ncbi:hypothetical protein BJ508DRAFT_309847 [Ascobolus immersus RN42]|uniref:C2H2-type domain-containing protein n=1 Tax=Ascobolus immersus RN42 TaxID=1160509 RepID=A0A3N4HV42_ASCIM|nr:hypothetical protein BJ508DRAFT_309847 [Ascobolus immersus RN42]